MSLYEQQLSDMAHSANAIIYILARMKVVSPALYMNFKVWDYANKKWMERR